MTTNTPGLNAFPRREEMNTSRHKLLKCKLRQGGFSSQRLFTIKDADNNDKVFGGYYAHFFDAERNPLDANYPPPGETVEGFTKCRVLKVLEGGETVIVDVPSSDAVVVKIDDLIELHPVR